MNISQEFSGELIISDFGYIRQNPSLLKALSGSLIAVLVPLVFFSIPARGSSELALTPDNILELTNQDRMREGLSPLRFDARLQAAAMEKAQDILDNDYFSHISPTGIAPWDFIRDQGFRYIYAGENLAINYTSPYELVNDFLQSPSHRENLLSPFYSDIGIAVATGIQSGRPAIVTVQLFATPSGN